MHAELVQRARSGDHEAFETLATAAFPGLHRTARLILRDEDLAGDAVQETLTQAWLDIRAVREPDRFEPWLHRVLIRTCYREAARQRRRRAVEIHVDSIDAPGDPGDGRELAARDLIDRGFRRLPPEHRAVLVVHHYLGLRDEEGAHVLSIPPGTFKSRLHRATVALRAAIEADERRSHEPVESIA